MLFCLKSLKYMYMRNNVSCNIHDKRRITVRGRGGASMDAQSPEISDCMHNNAVRRSCAERNEIILLYLIIPSDTLYSFSSSVKQ